MSHLEFTVGHFLQKHGLIILSLVLILSIKIPLLLVKAYLPELKA